jgi:SAM-dependent methyltransferase
MTDYYARKLSGERLQRCYEVASPRVQQYFESEIEHLRRRIIHGESVLELGCGYGRVTLRLTDIAGRLVGIDNAEENLALARRLAGPASRCEFLLMDALSLSFAEGEFDLVICIQNGICAFGVDQESLVREALRVTREGGRVLLSTYADRFWGDRLAWFEAQAAEGLVGPIDHAASRDGVIACRDGFRSGRLTPADLLDLAARFPVSAEVRTVDDSCVFCEMVQGTR